MARMKVKPENSGAEEVHDEKDQKGVGEQPPKAKRGGQAAKSPKAKTDGVKKAPMKAKEKADGAKSAKKKVSKHPPTSTMVAEAFTVLKNRKGLTLAAIRNYIAKTYECEVTKQIQKLIKKYIADEFEAGRIKMINDDADEIKYNQRFALAK